MAPDVTPAAADFLRDHIGSAHSDKAQSPHEEPHPLTTPGKNRLVDAAEHRPATSRRRRCVRRSK
jgi:hypothetical protein